jgi:hypothetical protein
MLLTMKLESSYNLVWMMLGSIFDGSIIKHPMDVFDKDLVIIKCLNGIVI